MTRTELDTLRTQYEGAVQGEKAAEKMWRGLKSYTGLEGIKLAYKASAQALLARYAWNPYSKLSHLREAMKVFKHAVRLDPQNIEIRFLRFAIQHYIPEFLDQSKDLHEDMEIMIAHLKDFTDFQMEKGHAETFLEFFKESDRFSEETLAKLKAELHKH